MFRSTAALFAILSILAIGCVSTTESPVPAAGSKSTDTQASIPVAGTSSSITSIVPAAAPSGVAEPRFAGANVVVLTGGAVSAYDSISLKEVWVSDSCPSASWPGPFSSVGSNTVVAMCAGKYSGVEASTGEIHWHFVSKDTVTQTRVGGSTMGIMTASVLRAIDLDTGALRWEKSIGEAGIGLDETTVYAATKGGVHAFDAATGVERWTAPLSAVDVFVGRGAVFVRTTQVRRIVRLDPLDGHVIWMGDADQNGLEHSGIVGVTEHAVVVKKLGVPRAFEGFDFDSGHLLWDPRGAADGKVDYDMATADRAVVLCSADGKVEALDDVGANAFVTLGVSAEQACAAHLDLVAWVDVGGEKRLRVSKIPPSPPS